MAHQEGMDYRESEKKQRLVRLLHQPHFHQGRIGISTLKDEQRKREPMAFIRGGHFVFAFHLTGCGWRECRGAQAGSGGVRLMSPARADRKLRAAATLAKLPVTNPDWSPRTSLTTQSSSPLVRALVPGRCEGDPTGRKKPGVTD